MGHFLSYHRHITVISPSSFPLLTSCAHNAQHQFFFFPFTSTLSSLPLPSFSCARARTRARASHARREWNAENCAKFPETYSILRSLRIPLAVRGVCFARQLPGSGVAPHTDGRNFILTSHLGLNVPESEGAGGGKDDDTKNDGGPRKGPWIKVGTETRKWTEGKLVTLDTSFEHSTGNPTRGVRDVLIVDFWHPELTEAERASLEFVYDLRNKFERGEIPVRKPRSVILAAERKEQEDKDGGGLGGLWKSLTGGGGGESGESGD